jgi:hypothetical protein
MKHWIAELIGVRLRELSGARLSGRLPFDEPLVNRLIADALLRAQSAVSAVVLEFLDAGAVTAHVRLKTPLVPPVTVHVKVARQPDLARSLPLVLDWSVTGLGAASSFLGLLASRFATLPPWLRVRADVAEVDLGMLIEERGFGEIVPYVTQLQISTAPARLVLDFEMRA